MSEPFTASPLHYLLATFSPFYLAAQPSADCWQLAVPERSHAEDSSNPNSLFLISVTSLQTLQELHFHLWLLLQTPVTQQVLQRQQRAYRPHLLPFLLSLPPQGKKTVQTRTISVAQTQVCWWLVSPFFQKKKLTKLRS